MSARDVLRANDERFLGVVENIRDTEWSRPSLCTAWTTRDVLAHLVIGRGASLPEVLTDIAAHGGSFDRGNAASARSLAATRSPADLLDDFAELIRWPRGIGRLFPPRLLLGDHVVHELDILYALDREPAIPVEVLIAVLNTEVGLPNPFVPAYRNSRKLRLHVTNADWSHGDRGPVVRGRATDIISVLANRPHMLERLDGDGVGEFASRVATGATTSCFHKIGAPAAA